MKWGRRSRAAETKAAAKKNTSLLSYTPSFQLSDVFFPFSWISRMKREKQSSLTTNSRPANPKRFPAGSSDHLCCDAGNAPRRRSTGDDDVRHKIAFGGERPDISRSARHFSLGELELRPISGYPRWDIDSPPTPMKRADPRRLRHRVRPKVTVCSPRAARRRMEGKNGERRSLESFAMVKSSIDPLNDFRESMLEMIWAKGMKRPEEMESLLACYISLNADEHHDFILKAFRQVLLDLKPRWLTGGRCHCCHCCHH